MAPKRPGPSSAYLGAYKDKAGEWLDGGNSYRLRVPANPPIKLFWSVTLYDIDTRALIVNDQKIADRSSRMDLRKNDDGSVDIYTGPQLRPVSRRTGSQPRRAGTGSLISASTNPPNPTSTGRGRCRTSSGFRLKQSHPRQWVDCSDPFYSNANVQRCARSATEDQERSVCRKDLKEPTLPCGEVLMSWKRS
jgi:hypothetical protein